jgi:hypothetical protein
MGGTGRRETSRAARVLLNVLDIFVRGRQTVLKLVRVRLGLGDARSCVVVGMVVLFAVVLVAPSVCLAAFTRPFVRQIARAEDPSGMSCPSERPPPSCLSPDGVAVGFAGDLWVGDGEDALAKFDTAGAFRGRVPLEETANALLGNTKDVVLPESLAIDRSTGRFYVTGEHDRLGFGGLVEVFEGSGKLCGRWGFFNKAHVALDDSMEPFTGPVYVSHGDVDPGPPYGDGLPAGVEKFGVNASCEPTRTPFTASEPYIEGTQIVGSPSGRFATLPGAPIGDVTVDSHGNIYVVGSVVKEGVEGPQEVQEYRLTGEFVRSFGGEATPGLGGSLRNGGWGSNLYGVAVDPANGDVLVSVSEGTSKEGAVDEFDSSGHFLKQTTETEVEVEATAGTRTPSRLHGAFGMTVDSQGDLYVVDKLDHVVDVYGPGHLLPTVKLGATTNRMRGGSVLHGFVDPEGLKLSDCHFEFVTEAVFEKEGFAKPEHRECVPGASSIPAGGGLVSVQAELAGLESGVTYRYRLAATTEEALGGSEVTPALGFTTPHAPKVSSTFASNLSSSFADLYAQIDPLGADTSYHFEYDTNAYVGEVRHGVSVPLTDTGIGAGGPTGGAEVDVVQQVGGLTPSTTYHFRVVAENSVEGVTEVVYGPDSTFATLPQNVAGLPDHRTYELVTPANKGSSSDLFVVSERRRNDFQAFNAGYAAESGYAFLLEAAGAAFGPFPNSGIFENTYVFSRTRPGTDGFGGGWAYTALASPSLGVQEAGGSVFDPVDLSRLVFADAVGSKASTEGQREIILTGKAGGPYTSLYASATGSHPAGEGEPGPESANVLGASQDLSHIVIGSGDHTLAPGASEQDKGSEALYEWQPIGANGCSSSSVGFSESTHGCMMLINVTSEGTLLNRCGAQLGQRSVRGRTHGAVSADGSRIIFTAPDPLLSYNPTSKQTKEATQECWDGVEKDTPQLYMRSGGQTLELSAPEEGVSDPTGSHPAIYVGASEDGSKVFFFTEAELTKDAIALNLHDPELYECDIIQETGTLKCKLTHISTGDPGSPAREPGSTGAHLLHVPAISTDGSAVYYTAYETLAPGAPPLKEPLQQTHEPINLYRYDTATSSTTFIATISERNYPNNALVQWWTRPMGEAALAPNANWYTTPDGNYLLFSSERELTGYNTSEAARCPGIDSQDSAADGHCTELYRYHYEPESPSGGNIVCVSCDPSGARPISNALFATLASRITADAGPVRAMSNDGSEIFFDTADPLVSRDGNKTLDVYEWHNGTISLISSGEDPAPSYFLGMSPDATNAFFGTHAKLVPEDTDTYGDLYDARTCTTTDPCIKPPPGETAQCEGDACQNPPPTPNDATPMSLILNGAGAGNFPGEIKPQVRSLTNTQRLVNALRACRKKPRRQRKTCEALAHKRYGKTSKSVRSSRRNRGRRTRK